MGMGCGRADAPGKRTHEGRGTGGIAPVAANAPAADCDAQTPVRTLRGVGQLYSGEWEPGPGNAEETPQHEREIGSILAALFLQDSAARQEHCCPLLASRISCDTRAFRKPPADMPQKAFLFALAFDSGGGVQGTEAFPSSQG